MGSAKRDKRSGKGRGGGSRAKQQSEDTSEAQVEPLKAGQSVEDRVLAVKPFWDGLTEEEQMHMLTLSVEDLRRRATELDELNHGGGGHHKKEAAGNLKGLKPVGSHQREALEEAVARLEARGTWKRWKIDGQEFSDAASFREFVARHLDDESRALLLSVDDDSTLEGSPKSHLNHRMTSLTQTVRRLQMQLLEDVFGNHYTKGAPIPVNKAQHWNDAHIDIIHIILDALGREHDSIYLSVLAPLTCNICNVLDDKVRGSSPMHLVFADLQRLCQDDLTSCSDWLAGKVDSLARPIKATSKVQERYLEMAGDDDCFILRNGSLTVSTTWLQFLKLWEKGGDGCCGPSRISATLNWIFEGMDTTNNGYRKLAKRSMGNWQPTIQEALDHLISALEEELESKKQMREAGELLKRLQLELQTLPGECMSVSGCHNTSSILKHTMGTPEQDAAFGLPAGEMLAMLKRELLLTDAKAHVVKWELCNIERRLKLSNGQLEWGALKYKHLQHAMLEIGEAKLRRPDHHRDYIEEEFQAQSALEEHAANLQGKLKEYQCVKGLAAEQKTESNEMKGRSPNLQLLIKYIEDLTNAALQSEAAMGAKVRVTEGPSRPAEASDSQDRSVDGQGGEAGAQGDLVNGDPRAKLRDLQKALKLSDQETAVTILEGVKMMVRECTTIMAEGRAALMHLEMYLVNVSCDDAGARIGSQLLFPLLQERLETGARESLARRSLEAQEALVQREEEERAQEELERSKKQAKKQKKKGRAQAERADATAMVPKGTPGQPPLQEDSAAEPSSGEGEFLQQLLENCHINVEGWVGAQGDKELPTVGKVVHKGDSAEQAASKRSCKGLGSHAAASNSGDAVGGGKEDGFLPMSKRSGRGGKVKPEATVAAEASGKNVGEQGSLPSPQAEATPPSTPERPRPQRPSVSQESGTQRAPIARGLSEGDGSSMPSAAGVAMLGIERCQVAHYRPQLPPEVEELVCCPISQELMMDAVTAQDGRTYSQAAIQQWLDTGARTSPLTNLEMGTTLLPNTLIRLIVQTCVTYLE